jgi:predicted membrane protein (TIGR00267 family)
LNELSRDHKHHRIIDPHGRGFWLADVVLGGQDGLVNLLGVILGIAAAAEDRRLVIVAGLAAAVAEAVSMGAVAYTTRVAESDLYRGEREREYRHIEAVPAIEREEVRQLYSKKGFSGELLDRIVETITRDKDVWVAVMMAEEHQMADTPHGASVRSAAIVGVSALVGSLLPLAPFVFAPVSVGVWSSVALSALVLFVLGAYKARLTIGSPIRSGLVLAGVGILSAFLAYAIGLLFGPAHQAVGLSP